MQNNQMPLIPQGTNLLIPKHELQAKLDHMTELYIDGKRKLEIAINLLTAEQLAEYRRIVENETTIAN